METTNNVNETQGATLKSSPNSKSLQEDAALRKLLAKDPVLGEVMKILFGKLDETNKRLDVIQGERPRGPDLCQDQVNQLLDAEVKIPDVKVPELNNLEVKVPEDSALILKKKSALLQPENNSEHQPLAVALGIEAVEDCLGRSKILRRILEQFSDKELINLSLVNKLWNSEARSLLKDRGCLTARIKTRPVCQGLVQFATDLQQMRVVPFAGISVSFEHSTYGIDVCESLSSESLHPSYQVILDRLPWKHLSVAFHGDLPEVKECPAFLLIQRILEEYCWVLEELSFNYRECQFVEFFQSIFQNRSFSFLKILKFARPAWYQDSGSPYTPAFVKMLVSRAPSLEKLCLDGPIKFQENVMEGSSAVLVATSGLRILEGQVCESLIDALRTESMDTVCEYWFGFDMELLNRFVPMLLRASHTTLKTLRMDLLFAVPLMCYGICLENVTDLSIYMKDAIVGTMDPDLLELVKAFDFTRVFPKLDKVTIRDHNWRHVSSHDISAFVEQGNAVATKAVSDRATNIRHLELPYCQKKSPPPLILLSQMFPHVKTLSMMTYDLKEFPFTLLWEHFGGLAELYVDFNGSDVPSTINLDSDFCGIFPEEVAELRAKDDEYLKAVNIVPVMPSIACMRGLWLFTLRYQSNRAARKDPTRIFSKVTGLIGFPRCPDLSVKLQTTFRSPKALDHMKPYVTVVTED